uniref:Hypothetical intron-encoded protein n=1 Tax=Mesostigma viride TaxID=41882 RepID=Q8W9R4_MESVI|nr:hypothetical intron-encoded protein [Mesostigma viride]AAL36744.1 hypothetical intron-encoded protein [Mesostigma viride]
MPRFFCISDPHFSLNSSLFLSVVTAISALSDPLDIWIEKSFGNEKFFYSRFMDQCIVACFSDADFLNSKFEKISQKSCWKFSKCFSTVPFLGGTLIHSSTRKPIESNELKSINNINSSWKWKISWNVLIRFCQNERYFHQNSAKPTAVPYLVPRTHEEILAHYKKLIFLFYLYYNPMQDHQAFNCLVDGLKESCILTLALKYKMKSRTKIIQKLFPQKL